MCCDITSIHMVNKRIRLLVVWTEVCPFPVAKALTLHNIYQLLAIFPTTFHRVPLWKPLPYLGSKGQRNRNRFVALIKYNNNSSNNNERIPRAPFHVKHAQDMLNRSKYNNTKHIHIRHSKQRVSKQSCRNIQINSYKYYS